VPQKLFNFLNPLEKLPHTPLRPPTYPRGCVKIINDFGTLRRRVPRKRECEKINKNAQLLKTNRCLGSCDTHTYANIHPHTHTQGGTHGGKLFSPRQHLARSKTGKSANKHGTQLDKFKQQQTCRNPTDAVSPRNRKNI